MKPLLRAAVAISAVYLICTLTLSACANPTLKIGDPAPAIKVAKWVKGAPVESFKKGNVYVVEFWASWCPICKASIPRLTNLAHKYAGKVAFTGVSVFEDPKAKANHDSSYIEKVNEFVASMGDRMDYTVAVDGPEGTMADTWLKATGQISIPTAFVIDQRRQIAWIGDPRAELDDVLGKVLQGRFDARAAAKLREEKEAESKRVQLGINRAASIMQSGNVRQGMAVLDRIVANYPDFKSNVLLYKFSLLTKVDESEAYRLARTLGDTEFKNNSMMLNQIAWRIAEAKGLKNPDFGVAIALAQRAVDLTKNEDFMILDTLGLALFNDGQIARAIEVQERAVSILNASKGVDANIRKEITERLELFKKSKTN
jgi:thiol-disulfide isomerase/thioredoxin